MNIKLKLLALAALAVGVSNYANAGEIDAEKATSVGNYALGIEPGARGNRFELLKTSPLGSGRAAAAGGFFGTAIAGINPFTVSGSTTAGGISMALDALSLLRKKDVKEPKYKEGKIQGAVFGKYFLTDEVANDSDANKKAAMDIRNNINKSSEEVFGTEAKVDEKFFSKDKFTVSGPIEIKQKDGKSFYIAFILNGKFIKPVSDKNPLGFDYQLENQENSNLQFYLSEKDEVTGKFVNKGKELMENGDVVAFVSKITEGKKLVLLTADLRQTFYDGNMYYEIEKDTTAEKSTEKHASIN